MNSTKVLKQPNFEHMPHSMVGHPAVFKIRRCHKPFYKEPFKPAPFPLKVDSYPNPPKMYQMEEEKAKKPSLEKENISLNSWAQRRMEMKPVAIGAKPTQHDVTPKPKVQKLVKLEKEVKLTGVDLNMQSPLIEKYDDERLALEDEYGIPQDEMFTLNGTEDYEEQSHIEEITENMNELRVSPTNSNSNDEVRSQCDGLKKGIDNDAIIADYSTIDGLSVFEDIIQGIKKKEFEDEEYENVDIFFPDTQPKSDIYDGVTHFDCTVSKGNDEDLEEEKIDTKVNKTPSENFALVDFMEDTHDFGFDPHFYNSPMLEQDVPLLKKNSLRPERGMSLFEEQEQIFAEDFSLKISDFQLRNRSLSKVTVDEWCNKEWKHGVSEMDPSHDGQTNQEPMEVDEPEYFKQFDKVLLSHNVQLDGVIPTVILEEDRNKILSECDIKDVTKSIKEPTYDSLSQDEGVLPQHENPESDMHKTPSAHNDSIVADEYPTPTCF